MPCFVHTTIGQTEQLAKLNNQLNQKSAEIPKQCLDDHFHHQVHIEEVLELQSGHTKSSQPLGFAHPDPDEMS